MSFVFLNHFLFIFPELFFISALLFILVHSASCNSSFSFRFPVVVLSTGLLSVQTLFITLFLILVRSWTYPSTVVIFHNILIFDDFTFFVHILLLLSALASILISFSYLRVHKINSFEYFILILFSTFSLLFLVSSFDLISMYLAIELQSLSFYVLAAFQRHNEFSTEAGLKYFILGALSSGLLLFGVSIVYGVTGLTNFEELSKLLSDDFFGFFALIGFFFILIAFFFKIGAVPFHLWLPDVYEGAPTSVTAFFSITPKLAVFALLLRLCFFSFYDFFPSWQFFVISCSFLSLFVGTFGALIQSRIKRLFAYSSIAHVGYLLISLASGTIESIESLLLYLSIYIVINIHLFSILLVLSRVSFHFSSFRSSFFFRSSSSFFGLSSFSFLRSSNPLWDFFLSFRLPSLFFSFRSSSPFFPIKHLSDFSSLSRSNPLLAFSAVLLLFSNAGIPPLAGFFGKLHVFLAAVESSLYFLAVAGVLCSVIGAFYSIRLVKFLYFHPSSFWHFYLPVSKENSFVLGLSFFFTAFFFCSPSFLFFFTHSAALSLCL